jgi:hypothetical protein
MAKHTQTKEELRQHMMEHLGFLKASAHSFDTGFTGEAKRLAVAVRVLVHDTDKSKSILSLLGIKLSMGFLDTAYEYNPKNAMSHTGLVGIRHTVGEGSRYFAKFEDNLAPKKIVLFSDWWNKIIIVDQKSSSFCRRELVLALANKDGGAHVDPALEESYANLTRNNSVGWIVSNGVSESPINGVELYSLRQIAYELIISIERYVSKHFS